MQEPSGLPVLAQATAAARRGEAWQSLALLREALESGRPAGRQWLEAVQAAGAIGDDHGAVLAAERLHRETGGEAGAAFVLAEALVQAGRAFEAVELLEPLQASGALSADQRFKYTRMLMFTGRAGEAERICRELLAQHADSPTLWERITQLRRFEAGDADLDRMRKLLEAWPAGKPAGLAAIATALAKAAVDTGDDALARRCLEARAAANRARFPFEPRALEEACRDILAWCESGEEDPPAAGPEGSGRPVFILGPPRSGTSLLDQVLSRHPDIRGGGELRHFWLATRELGDCSATRMRAVVDSLPAGTPEAALWEQLGRRYLLLADERFGPGTRFSDKLLSNAWRLRALRRCLPGARVVYVRRRPLDIAWSCWRTQFDAESGWANSPEGIALYLRCYDSIMQAWMRRYPGWITELSYEALVREPGSAIPALLAACGLSDHPATRHPEQSRRSVITWSYSQVRAPINTSSIDSGAGFPLSTAALRAALESQGAWT